MSTPTKPQSRWQCIRSITISVLLLYLVTVYLIVPAIWKDYARHHPALEDTPGLTYTADGIPGDPLNVAIVGTKAEAIRIMLAAQWHPADPLSLRSCLEIAAATMLDRPYADAPVSSLYLWGRKEDLAFEQEVGPDPQKRHHVRFWQSEKVDADGRPLWVGSATYDQSVGLSHTTGQITHHIAADVDAERDHLFQSLEQTHDVDSLQIIPDFHKIREGRNGGGDLWHTDGKLYVVVTKQRA